MRNEDGWDYSLSSDERAVLEHLLADEGYEQDRVVIETHANGLPDLDVDNASENDDALLASLREAFPKDGSWISPSGFPKVTKGQARYFLKALDALDRLAAVHGSQVGHPYDTLRDRLMKATQGSPQKTKFQQPKANARRSETLALAGLEDDDLDVPRTKRRPASEPKAKSNEGNVGEYHPSNGRMVMSQKRLDAAERFFSGIKDEVMEDPAFPFIAKMPAKAKKEWAMTWLRKKYGDQFYWPPNKAKKLLSWIGLSSDSNSVIGPEEFDGRPEAGTIKDWFSDTHEIAGDVLRIAECWEGPKEALTPQAVVSILREEYYANDGPVSERGMSWAVQNALDVIRSQSGRSDAPGEAVPDYESAFPSLLR